MLGTNTVAASRKISARYQNSVLTNIQDFLIVELQAGDQHFSCIEEIVDLLLVLLVNLLLELLQTCGKEAKLLWRK